LLQKEKQTYKIKARRMAHVRIKKILPLTVRVGGEVVETGERGVERGE